MDTKKLRVGIAALAVAFLTVSASYAQPQGPGKGEGNHEGGKREEIFKELNLTPEQQQKLDANRQVQRQEMEKLIAAIKDAQTKLRDAMKDPGVTRAAVEPIASNLKSLQAQMIDHRINGIFAVKAILTPEQFVKFQQLVEKRREGAGERFGNWREKRKDSNQDQKTM